jgi:hypothetical protein
MKGYKRVYRSSHTVAPQQLPWPASYTRIAYNVLQANTPYPIDIIIASAQILFMALTFCRADTLQGISLSDFDVTILGIIITLHKQKRPHPNFSPRQIHPIPHSHTPMAILHQHIQHFSPMPSTIIWPPDTMNVDKLFTAFCIYFRLGHWTPRSMRIGAATSAHLAGMPLETIRRRMFHGHSNTTLGYIRHGEHIVPTQNDIFFYGHP